MSRSYLLISRADRDYAISCIAQAPVGTRVEVQEPDRRTSAQNRALWHLLDEISRQVIWYGEKLTPAEWKDVFTASLKKQTRIVPGTDEKSFVVLGLHTSKLSKSKFNELLEIIQEFGTQHGVVFHDSHDWQSTLDSTESDAIDRVSP